MKVMSLPLPSTLALACAAALSGCANTPLEPDVSAALKPPAGQVLSLVTRATGVQIYACKAAAEDAGQYVWTFVAPEADLFEASGLKIGVHRAGPSWEANDGSKVVGRVLVQEGSVRPTAIPSLLLEAVSNEGDGVFSRVRSIQRLQTVGGKMPSTACAEAFNGRVSRVPYTASYYFYVDAETR